MLSRWKSARRVAFAVCLASTAAPLFAQEAKIAVIDVTRIMTESKRGQAVVAELEKLQLEKRDELEALTKEATDLRNRIQEGRLSLTEGALSELEAQLQEQTLALERAREDAQRDLQQMQATDIKKVEDDVMPIIQEVGKELGFTLIFNKFQSGLVYATDDVDITDLILQRFDAASGG